MSDEPAPTPTHICVDGTRKPGRGRYGKLGVDRCEPCYKVDLQKRSERRARKREEKYSKSGISQVGLTRGNGGRYSLKHGFYRKKLDEDEAKAAEELHRAIVDSYQLDPLVDDIAVHMLVTNIVKMLRREPEKADHNIVDRQSYYERQVREGLDNLGLSRKMRSEEGTKDSIRDALGALFKPSVSAVKQTDEGRGGIQPAP
jgi:hypothetical protein